MEKYWQDMDVKCGLRLPTRIVLHETFDEVLQYYEGHDMVALNDELVEKHTIGFLDTNDVLHFHASDEAEIADMVSFFTCVAVEWNPGVDACDAAWAAWKMTERVLDLMLWQDD